MPASLLVAAAFFAQADDFAKAWDLIERRITTGFYARETRGEEMKRRLAEAKPKALAAKSRDEFRDRVIEMIEGFQDSHFDFMTPADQSYYVFENLSGGKQEMRNIGAWFSRSKGVYTVKMVMNGGEADLKGLKKGDEVITRGFSPVESFKGESTKLTVKRGAETITVDVVPTTTTALGMFLDGSRKSVRTINRNNKKIGYFRLWTMTNDDFRNATRAAISSLMNTDAFILDLRDGFGGRPEGFLDNFFLPGVKMEWDFGAMTQTQYLGYAKPLIVLTNEGTRSAKEVAAYALKKSGRGVLVGSRTAGHVLGTTPMRLNEWSFLEVPIVTLKVDGVSLEDNGVEPHIPVMNEFSAKGDDLVLEKGIQTAVEKIGN